MVKDGDRWVQISYLNLHIAERADVKRGEAHGVAVGS